MENEQPWILGTRLKMLGCVFGASILEHSANGKMGRAWF